MKKLLLFASVGPRFLACVSFFLILQSVSAAVWPSDGTPQSIQYFHDTSAQDGDTITLPSGTFTWTTHVNVTKGITIQGQTTCNSVTGVCTDTTKIIDNLTRVSGGQGFFHLSSAAGQRITGIAFTGTGGNLTQMYNGAIRINGAGNPARIDHCHFTNLAHAPIVQFNGRVGSVFDHNVAGSPANSGTEMLYSLGEDGDAVFAQTAGFGGPNFLFVEDNYIDRPYTGNFASLGIDGRQGVKWCIRYNRIHNVQNILVHGTENDRARGGRANELYNNIFTFDYAALLDGWRSGSVVVHDNTFLGVRPRQDFGLGVYRAFFNKAGNPWGPSGDSPWDVNVTESDGVTHIDGHPPYLFESGTATSGSTSSLTDTAKNWTTNRWVGYSVKRITPNRGLVGWILGNSTNTLNVFFYSDQDQTFATWKPGDQYQIHRVKVILDQPCRGRGDLITGNPPINTVTGNAAWPHQAIEPCYSWNNIFTPTNAHINFAVPITGNQLLVQGRDYFSDTPKPGYIPYTYPHPLVSGGPEPTPTPTATATATAAPTPAAPTALRPTNETARSFTANWSRVSGATGYWLDVSRSSTFASYVSGYQNRNVGNVTSQNVTGLAANTFYYYRVRSYNGNGTSRNSNVIKAKTKTR